MAQIDLDTIKRIEKERNLMHEKVFATYSAFNIAGDKYVQLDTYGKSDREIPGKISQSIQLDEESARFLVKLLVNEFDFSFKLS